MKAEYMTVYETSYAIVKSFFRKKMTFEEAEKEGKEYCKNNGFMYLKTEEVKS